MRVMFGGHFSLSRPPSPGCTINLRESPRLPSYTVRVRHVPAPGMPPDFYPLHKNVLSQIEFRDRREGHFARKRNCLQVLIGGKIRGCRGTYSGGGFGDTHPSIFRGFRLPEKGEVDV
jgi:hypothetical protein